MSKAIYKYNLSKNGTTELRIPVNAQILSVKAQFDLLVMYVLVTTDSNTPTELRRFETVYTGQSLSDSIQYFNHIGTAVFDDGASILHVLEYSKHL
jgi:alpha-mannosidase